MPKFQNFSRNFKLIISLSLSLIFISFLTACNTKTEPAPVRFEGQIFGSFWHATLIGQWTEQEQKNLKNGIEQELKKVDASMSTYKTNSELNQFNAAQLNEWLDISEALYEVLHISQAVAQTTQGAFDITLGSLVNLWNFGPEQRSDEMPASAEIEERLSQVGYQYLELNSQTRQARRLKNSYLDLSGVAKGYATDKVAQWLLSQGVENFLINISGEIYVAGQRKPEQPWSIGIEAPLSDLRAAKYILPLSNNSIATSGDYRNFYEIDGRRISHTIDPKTGYPINHNLASVTVIHPQNAVADAWATAFMVLGTEKSLHLANQENLKVLFISRTEQGFKASLSNSMQEMLGPELTKKIMLSN